MSARAPAPPPAPRPPRTAKGGSPPELLAGRYRLLEPVGEGGHASVFRAFDETERVFRAVKILDRRVADHPRVRQRLLDEAHIMARLQHPNVVKLFEAGSDGNRLYLVMELLLGGSVEERIAQAPLPPHMASDLIRAVLAALQLAHDNGVVHRDVKPHNILLDPSGVPKVTDFGIARLEDGGMTRTGVVLGTLAYMPPEQKLSARKVDARSDIYSAGATLYALVTGREPHDLYAAALDPAIAAELYESVPPDLAAVIMRATAFRPEDRYASASAMAAALSSAVARVAPDPPGPPLVSLERLSLARAGARLGPTLLGVTGSDEDGSPLTPVPLDPLPPVPWIRLTLAAVAAFAVVSGAVVGARAALDRVPERVTPIAQAVAVPAPVAQQGPIQQDTGAEESTERPRRRRSAQAEAPAPSPGPSVDAASLTEQVGAWQLQTWPGKRARTEAVASIPADVVVVDARGHEDRPLLVLQCLAGSARLVLRTRLAGFGEDKPGVVWVDVGIDGRSGLRFERVRGSAGDAAHAGDLVVPRVGWWSDLLDARQVVVRYPPLGGGTLEARFTLGETAPVQAALAAGCR